MTAGSLYVFGHPTAGPPYKVGAASDLRRRLTQLKRGRQTLLKMGVDIDLEPCLYLAAWDGRHHSFPRGLEGEILRALLPYRLKCPAKRKNGHTTGVLTEWVDLPLDQLQEAINSHPWMRKHPQISPPSVTTKLARRKIDGFTLSVDELSAIDAWRAEQDPEPTRPEAIRYALRDWLIGMGMIPLDKTDT